MSGDGEEAAWYLGKDAKQLMKDCAELGSELAPPDANTDEKRWMINAQRKRARLEEKAEEESSMRAKLGSAGLGLSANSIRRLAKHEKSNAPRSTQDLFHTPFLAPAAGIGPAPAAAGFVQYLAAMPFAQGSEMAPARNASWPGFPNAPPSMSAMAAAEAAAARAAQAAVKKAEAALAKSAAVRPVEESAMPAAMAREEDLTAVADASTSTFCRFSQTKFYALDVTPPGSSTNFHQDGAGTVDSGHYCLSGYNEVVMLRRLPLEHKHRALFILANGLVNKNYDSLFDEPHADKLGAKPDWPTTDAIEECRRMGYCPSVFVLKPGQFVHINKGRLHAFRKMAPTALPPNDCHRQLRLDIIDNKELGSIEHLCISVAWDWMARSTFVCCVVFLLHALLRWTSSNPFDYPPCSFGLNSTRGAPKMGLKKRLRPPSSALTTCRHLDPFRRHRSAPFSINGPLFLGIFVFACMY